MKKPRNQKTVAYFWITLAAASIMSVISSTWAAEKPNILVIWGDDVGVHNISAYNHGIMGYETPNIDRLASEGSFSQMPMPSRVVLLGAPLSYSASIRFEPVC